MSTELNKDLLKYFVDEFSFELLVDKSKPRDKKEKFVVETFNRVSDIYSVVDKLGRYELYFEKFYPNVDSISEAEALEYHLHSYLEEIYSLREKLVRLLNTIKKGVKLFDIGNSQDVDKIVEHIKKQIENGLTETLKLRGEHVHNRSIRDLNITKAKALKTLSDMGQIKTELFHEKYAPLITVSKQKYMSQARNNTKEMIKMMNFTTCRIGHLLATYFGHSTERFTKLI